MYSAYSIANAFIERAIAGRIQDLSSMKLQKLLYFAQAWHLQVEGFPFFEDCFIRGETGPILPSIQHQLKAYGSRPVFQTVRILSGSDDPLRWRIPTLPSDHVRSWKWVDAVIRRFGHLSAQALSDLTHLPGSAWSQGAPDGGPITHESILNDATV
ncbi:Panacea domain-containing protein [Mitsuaria sp. GD03876]|uniref:Panacea domain-containing protein n=1 Tax=Mitsuaria sp. GD03876 TaxID=2975399 RepID=UPI00244BDA0B|nr:Panacea domain-containing protein [Mitsuaria sp. GD03876]MDH0867184.1 Panacea domain-containing protein [Mitsuaria sp. GD03876]